MDKFCTPKSMAASSVFLTPPASLEKEDQDQSLKLSPLFPPFLTLFTPPNDVYSQEVTERDFLKILRPGFPHIVKKILHYLSPVDLSMCLRVSHAWRDAIMGDTELLEAIRRYRKEQKKNAENLNKTDHQRPTRLGPLTNIKNIPSEPPLSPPTNATSSTGSHLRPCPNCQSPARSVEKNRALCNHCHYDFCLLCFRDKHIGECNGQRSPKRPAKSTAIAGTKKSRKRLKRL